MESMVQKAAAILILACLTPLRANAQPEYSLERELTIGALDGEYALTQPGQLVIMPGGGVLVTQPQEQLVRRFDAHGRIMRALGVRGDGPGEFRSIDGVGMRGDSIWIADSRLRRMTYFAHDGTVLATVSWPGASRAPANPAGTGYASFEYSRNGAMDLDPDAPWPVIRYSRAGAVLDTVAVVHAYAKGIRTEGGTVLRSPLNDGAMSRFSPGGERLVIVDRRVPEAGPRGRFTVTWVSTARGDTLRRSAYEYTAKPIPADYMDQLIARAAGGPMRQYVNSIAAALREQRFLPPISRMQVTDDSTVWLARETAGQDMVRWYRFAVDAGATGFVLLPVRSEILAADASRLWVLEHDEFDVPYLVRYRMRSPDLR
jgi:hypothetical protein